MEGAFEDIFKKVLDAEADNLVAPYNPGLDPPFGPRRRIVMQLLDYPDLFRPVTTQFHEFCQDELEAQIHEQERKLSRLEREHDRSLRITDFGSAAARIAEPLNPLSAMFASCDGLSL